MLRFYGVNFTASENVKVTQHELIFDSEMWKEYRNIVRSCVRYHDCLINLVPIRDKEGKLVSYGYQDNEADRELRMLKELTRCSSALQFHDIFQSIMRSSYVAAMNLRSVLQSILNCRMSKYL